MSLIFTSEAIDAEIKRLVPLHTTLQTSLVESNPNEIIDLGTIETGVWGTRLVASQVFDRILAAWIYGRLIDSIGLKNAKNIGIWREGEIQGIDQFNAATGTREVLCFSRGETANSALTTLIEAVRVFDPNNFDSDGFILTRVSQ